MARWLSQSDCHLSGVPFDIVLALCPPLPETVTEGEIVCGICLQTQDVGSEASKLTCGHWFCYECLEHWFIQSYSCPTCRTTPGTSIEIEVDMDIDSNRGKIFGIIGKLSKYGLCVLGLTEGSILQQWNDANPTQQVQQGDLIRSLNGKPSTFDCFRTAIACPRVRMEVLKPQAWRPVAVSDIKPASDDEVAARPSRSWRDALAARWVPRFL
jgi:hypothetical protein